MIGGTSWGSRLDDMFKQPPPPSPFYGLLFLLFTFLAIAPNGMLTHVGKKGVCVHMHNVTPAKVWKEMD